ncbi:type II toxin-antitoxin system Phd/YefM family antitoxin [Methylovulum miyakonense]|uniref:type II toxin-antitoxin system Phd/YefM family antitoxin n=1 Tax=Methylovulum miyakonense TaxID=645578 RepID=UPI00037554B9|nr:type II toxin-antitoxin system prevent-host-death family antitoxin [Methylovulum miyakonense]
MQAILAPFSASISELKKNPTALLKQAQGEAIAILNHNLPTAYLVPADVYQQLLEKLEDYELGKIFQERQAEKHLAIDVMLDDL